MHDIPRLVLDANIMISALMGRSFSLLVSLTEQGVLLITTEAQLHETRRILQEKSSFSRVEIEQLLDQLSAVVACLPVESYADHEAKARARLEDRGQPDWPVLAASYETASAIWSHDGDLFGSGAAIWSTRILRRELHAAAA